MGFTLFDCDGPIYAHPPGDARVSPKGNYVSIYVHAADRTGWRIGDYLYGALDPQRPGTFALLRCSDARADTPPLYRIRVTARDSTGCGFRCICTAFLRAAGAIPGAYYSMSAGAGGWIFTPIGGSK